MFFCYTGRLRFAAADALGGGHGGGAAAVAGQGAVAEATARAAVGPELICLSREYGLAALAGAAATAIVDGLTPRNVCGVLVAAAGRGPALAVLCGACQSFLEENLLASLAAFAPVRRANVVVGARLPVV